MRAKESVPPLCHPHSILEFAIYEPISSTDSILDEFTELNTIDEIFEENLIKLTELETELKNTQIQIKEITKKIEEKEIELEKTKTTIDNKIIYLSLNSFFKKQKRGISPSFFMSRKPHNLDYPESKPVN